MVAPSTVTGGARCHPAFGSAPTVGIEVVAQAVADELVEGREAGDASAKDGSVYPGRAVEGWSTHIYLNASPCLEGRTIVDGDSVGPIIEGLASDVDIVFAMTISG